MHVQYSFNYPAAAIGDGFGATKGRANPHRGQDVAPNGGGPVYALADGVLVYDWYSLGMGHVAVIAHADGKFSGYAHLAFESPLTIGTNVSRNQSIGTIGNTGKLSRGRHLHITLATSMAGAAGGFDVLDPMAWVIAHSGPQPSTTAHTGTRTGTAEDGEPGEIYWTKVQSETKARGWYTGLVDGKPGGGTHHAHARLQAAILNENRGSLARTSTEEDGDPGAVFWTLAQTQGRAFGYEWEIDGIPGPNTEKALYRQTATWLNAHGR
jgi:hypothetical protein